jgi:hypothetical protein
MTDSNHKDEITTPDNNNFKVQSVYNLMTKSDEQINKEICMSNTDTDDLLESGENINQQHPAGGRRSLLNRVFSPMQAGSLRGSVFAMSSLALGTGCLALPKNFGTMSFTCALLVLLLGSAAAYWSLTIMIEASRKTKVTEYSRLVKESLGKKMALFLDIMILIYIFGILISYQVISKSTYNNITNLFLII